MKDKLGFNIIWAMMAFILGSALFREFDLQTFTFKKTALGLLYLVVFLFALYLTFKKDTKTPKE